MTPQGVGLVDAQLQPCPAAPHCANSDVSQGGHGISPLIIKGDPALAWRALQAEIATWPRSAIVSQSDTYLHVEQHSRIFRFVDDVEFVLRGAQGEIGMRSASRYGYYDFEVNRDRLKRVRKVLMEKGVVR